MALLQDTILRTEVLLIATVGEAHTISPNERMNTIALVKNPSER